LDSIKLVVNGDVEFFLYFLQFVVEVFGLIKRTINLQLFVFWLPKE